MTSVGLPLYQGQSGPRAIPPELTFVDRSKPYPSCSRLEEGLAFRWRSLHSCLMCFRDGGFPHLADFNGGTVSPQQMLAERARIIRENQTTGHKACQGCPMLVTKKWAEPKYLVKYIGIAHFTHCNIECTYCYLQWQDRSTFADGYRPYELLPAFRELIDKRQLSPKAVVEWGGGEPTIYREFDDVLRLLTEHGATTVLRTNGTRMPKPIVEGLDTRNIQIICSLDAGTRETWKLIKKRDLLDEVWDNLHEYIRRGCRVTLKYIMMDENCAEAELKAFLAQAVRIGARELMLDVDYTHAPASAQVVEGLKMLKRMAVFKGMRVTFGSTGVQLSPEIGVAGRLDCLTGLSVKKQIEFRLRQRLAHYAFRARNIARRLR